MLSGPSGIVSATEQSHTTTAGTNLNQIAQRDANHTTGRRWLHNVGQHISLFVAGTKDKIALKLMAAKGKVQAQSDAMELTADKDLTITSTKGKVQIIANQEILLTSGGGYIRMAGGNIDIHCPSTVSVKGADHQLSGGTKLELPPLELLNAKDIFDERLKVEHHFSPALHAGYRYEMTMDDGTVHSGVFDKQGMTQRIYSGKEQSFSTINIIPSKIQKIYEGYS